MHKNTEKKHKSTTKRIDCYIPGELYMDLQKSNIGITKTVVEALTHYLHNDTTTIGYNYEVVDLLKNENQYLKDRLDFYMTPWYLRIFRKQLPQLPSKKEVITPGFSVKTGPK